MLSICWTLCRALLTLPARSLRALYGMPRINTALLAYYVLDGCDKRIALVQAGVTLVAQY
jgi:hypothetical protein